MKKVMKITLIVILSMLLVFILFQAFVSNSSSKIEMPKYTVLKKFEKFEIRKYEAVNFTYVNMPKGSYKETSGKGFRTLAAYIFGDNDKNAKIAMTSPVTMNFEDSTTMMFMVPSEYDLNDLPQPTDGNIRFKKEAEKTVAAIKFGGWANDKKIKEYAEELHQLLLKEGIVHDQHYSFLGYNAPFDLFNRRNEVIYRVEYP